MTALPAGRLHRLDGAPRNARLDEDRLDLVLDDEIDHTIDVPQAGFGQRADALQSDDAHPVSAPEVTEGVVRGDQNAAFFG